MTRVTSRPLVRHAGEPLPPRPAHAATAVLSKAGLQSAGPALPSGYDASKRAAMRAQTRVGQPSIVQSGDPVALKAAIRSIEAKTAWAARRLSLAYARVTPEQIDSLEDLARRIGGRIDGARHDLARHARLARQPGGNVDAAALASFTRDFIETVTDLTNQAELATLRGTQVRGKDNTGQVVNGEVLVLPREVDGKIEGWDLWVHNTTGVAVEATIRKTPRWFGGYTYLPKMPLTADGSAAHLYISAAKYALKPGARLDFEITSYGIESLRLPKAKQRARLGFHELEVSSSGRSFEIKAEELQARTEPGEGVTLFSRGVAQGGAAETPPYPFALPAPTSGEGAWVSIELDRLRGDMARGVRFRAPLAEAMAALTEARAKWRAASTPKTVLSLDVGSQGEQLDEQYEALRAAHEACRPGAVVDGVFEEEVRLCIDGAAPLLKLVDVAVRIYERLRETDAALQRSPEALDRLHDYVSKARYLPGRRAAMLAGVEAARRRLDDLVAEAKGGINDMVKAAHGDPALIFEADLDVLLKDGDARLGHVVQQAEASVFVGNQAKAFHAYGRVCEGRVRVEAIADPDGKIARWEIWFLNEGATPFLGTASFTASAKNTGHGFESMGCPRRGAAAMQPVWADKKYGVDPTVGAELRLGVRGYGWVVAGLPPVGQVVEIPIEAFEIEGGGDRYFAADLAETKRQEKSAKVMCFDSGLPVGEPFAGTQIAYPFAPL